MGEVRQNTGLLRFCAWMGPAFTAMWLIGAGPVTHWTFILPPSAANTAAETLRTYLDHLVAIRVGCVVMIFACCLYTFWGMAISMCARRAEGDRPILFYVQVVSLAACVVVVMFIGFFWGVAAFRAGETTPEVTQALNDLGWFGVLFTSAPFTAWAIALGAAILMDKSARPVFARWVGYLNIAAGILFVEAPLLIFFKTGPFSQNGIVVFYVPMTTFFVWIVTMSIVVNKVISDEAGEVRETSLGDDADQDGRLAATATV